MTYSTEARVLASVVMSSALDWVPLGELRGRAQPFASGEEATNSLIIRVTERALRGGLWVAGLPGDVAFERDGRSVDDVVTWIANSLSQQDSTWWPTALWFDATERGRRMGNDLIPLADDDGDFPDAIPAGTLTHEQGVAASVLDALNSLAT